MESMIDVAQPQHLSSTHDGEGRGSSSRPPGKGSQKRRGDQLSGAPEKKQRRPKYTQQACDGCRQRKIKCCGSHPCNRCVSRREMCTYSSPENQNTAEKAICAARNSEFVQIPGLGSREAALVNSVRELEEMVRDLREKNHTPIADAPATAEGPDPASRGDVLEAEDNRDEQATDEPTEETDDFEISNCGQGTISLKSKIAAVHSSLSRNFADHALTASQSSGSPLPHSTSRQRRSLSLELPSPRRLLHILKVFFEENNAFFPCVEQIEFENRLLKLLSSQGYSATSLLVAIDDSQILFASLICVMIALTEFLDPENQTLGLSPAAAETPYIPGKKWHDQAVSFLRRRRDHLLAPDLDIVRFYNIEALYMMHVEQLGEASKSILMAIHSSIRSGLNDQATWENCSPTETTWRRMLWWSVYYMDRRIAEKCGRPYFMRDNEIDVEDNFSGISENAIPITNEYGVQILREQAQPRSRMYLQTLVSWARLWSQMWDNFFALQAQKLGDQDEVDIMDRRIVNLKRNLPAELTFDIASLPYYIQSGENERDTRYRLLIFTRINLLRLILRHNPLVDLQNDPQTIEHCGLLAIETVNAIVRYMEKYYQVGPLGVFCTTSLVECICHLVPSLAASVPKGQREAATEALEAARQLLQRISTYHNAAKRAQKMLKHIFDAVSGISKDRMGISSSKAAQGLPAPTANKNGAYNPLVESNENNVFNDVEGITPSYMDGDTAEMTVDDWVARLCPMWDGAFDWPANDLSLDVMPFV